MSNSRVRKELEARDRKTKAFQEYGKVRNLITDYQVCKAYFNDMSASIIGVVGLILKTKYDLPWQTKFINKATLEARGKKNAVINIPQFKFEEHTNDIIAKFVNKNFERMLSLSKQSSDYPIEFKNVAERY